MTRINIHRALENAEDATYQIIDKLGSYYSKSDQKKIKDALKHIHKAQIIMDGLIN